MVTRGIDFMNKFTRSWVLIGCAIILLIACGEETRNIQNGEQPPSFNLMQLSLGDVSFPDDYANKVVAIRFWLTGVPFVNRK